MVWNSTTAAGFVSVHHGTQAVEVFWNPFISAKFNVIATVSAYSKVFDVDVEELGEDLLNLGHLI